MPTPLEPATCYLIQNKQEVFVDFSLSRCILIDNSSPTDVKNVEQGILFVN
jgi:hypothetical protein